MAYIKPWLKKIMDKLPEAEQEEFKAKSQGAMKFLLGKIKELQLYGPSSSVYLIPCFVSLYVPSVPPWQSQGAAAFCLVRP